jgi:hypothetical protein
MQGTRETALDRPAFGVAKRDRRPELRPKGTLNEGPKGCRAIEVKNDTVFDKALYRDPGLIAS